MRGTKKQFLPNVQLMNLKKDKESFKNVHPVIWGIKVTQITKHKDDKTKNNK
jgi:hypothetical protein